jgi:hypothetical protein
VNTGHHEVLDASPLTVHELVSVLRLKWRV